MLGHEIGLQGQSGDNSFHVVTKSSLVSSLLDGITIADGLADGTQADERRGGGINTSGSIELNACVIENCSALDSGSAIYHSGSGVEFILSNCTLRGNSVPSVRNENGGIMTIRNTNTLQNDN